MLGDWAPGSHLYVWRSVENLSILLVSSASAAACWTSFPSWKDGERLARFGYGVPRISPKFQHAVAFRPDFAGSSATGIGLHPGE